MQHPHCDQRVLHAPGVCEYCDRHPERQELRRAWGIAFTGEAPTTSGWTRQLPCPADFNRPAGGPNDHRRWHGNQAAPVQQVLASIEEYSNAVQATAGRPVVTNTAALVATFTEWDRRYREEPGRFQSEAEHLLKGTPESYGEACTPYFLDILDDVS
jgi:hypothetical protein